MHQKSWRISSERELSEVTLSETTLDEVKPDGVTSHDGGMLWVSLAFVLGWIVFFIKVLGMWMIVRKEIDALLKPVDTPPCKNCQFFANNRYLNCSVHPSIVLTEQAVNCPDYCSENSNFIQQKNSQK